MDRKLLPAARRLLPFALSILLCCPWNAQADSGGGASGATGQDQAAPPDDFLCPAVVRKVFGPHTQFAERGIDFEGWLQLDGATLAKGGVSPARGFDGQYLLDLSATFDTRKLVGWPGGTLMVDMQTHSGPNIVNQYTTSLQDPDNMDAYSFTEIDRGWYRQMLLRHTLQLQVGLMYVDDQYFTVPYGQNFISLNFSSDASISTFVLPTYPKGSFGGDVFVYPEKGVYFSGGVFNDHSTELPYDPGGDLWVTEEGWQHKWEGLPFSLEVGAWRDTGRFRSFNGSPGSIVHGAAGKYLVAAQKLWHPATSPDRGLGAFLQLGTAPPSVAPINRHVGAGVVWDGALTARPHDEIGFAFSDGFLSNRNRFLHGFENEFEAYYQIYASSYLTIQPDVEYWQHPGGMTTPNTLLYSVRAQYNF
ncbi:MAG: carbohydrate porin [Terriglobales bacterium]